MTSNGACILKPTNHHRLRRPRHPGTYKKRHTMTETPVESREEKSRARKAVVAAGLGNALEWYDIILFGFMAT